MVYDPSSVKQACYSQKVTYTNFTFWFAEASLPSPYARKDTGHLICPVSTYSLELAAGQLRSLQGSPPVAVGVSCEIFPAQAALEKLWQGSEHISHCQSP